MTNSSQKLQQTQAIDTYSRIVRGAPFGIYVVDADFCLVEISDGCKKVFSNIDPLIGRDFAEILRIIWEEPFSSECISRFRHTLVTGEPYQASDTSKPRGDVDEDESYDWKIERVEMPDGRYGVVCYFYDLTERISFEEKLRASEAFNRTVLESSPDCVKILDAAGRLQYLNQNGVCLLELDDAADVIGNFWWTMWSDAMQQPIKDAVAKALAGEPSHFQAFSPTAKGSPKWWDVIISLVPDAEGEEPRLISVSRDVTESKQVEHALRDVRDQLEVKVVERTAELMQTHSEFVRLLREVVAVQETERQRLSRDVHDHLGGTLTGLRLNLESLLAETHFAPHLQQRIESIQKIAKNLDSDVSYLAWMLRPAILDELGLVPALDSFVREWSERFSTHAEFHATNVSDGMLGREIETNLYRIAQEALTNAAKHAQATSVSVILEQRPDRLQLIIEDNGVGFSQVPPERPSLKSDARHGLGIGGMRDRARLIGASFQIDVSEGGGTSIYVAVPMG